MFHHLLRKRAFVKNLSLLRGAKKLREQNTPLFVANSVSLFTETSLNLDSSKFPKSLVGDHSSKAEILLRQVLLKRYTSICISIMQSIGSNKPLVIALPATWLNVLRKNNVECSLLLCKMKLLLTSFVHVAFGICQILYLVRQFSTTKKTTRPYVVFMELSKNNLQIQTDRESYDIISWYKKSVIRKSNINEIWTEIKSLKNGKKTPDVFIQNNIFPRLSNWYDYCQLLLKYFIAFNIAIFGIIRGRWWYGYLFAESVKLHYVKLLKSEQLADEYYFNNSGWFYRPLWTYEVEVKGATVSLYYYSTNIEHFQYNEHLLKEIYGLKIMSWNRYIVWDEEQANYLRQFAPEAKYIIVGPIDFSDNSKTLNINNSFFNIAIFDVTAVRPSCYIGLGIGIAPYYSDKLALKFFLDIEDVANTEYVHLLLKQKRILGRNHVSPASAKKRNEITNRSFISIEPSVSAKYLIDCSDAVISMPFTSTALIGRDCGKPSIFYDVSGKLQKKEHHGIPILKNKNELETWLHSIKPEKIHNGL
jgi:polysaccharide biosynthesis PFTS motif protein